ncbi:Fatty acid desaturase [Spraguea lophii 42_110]|uniref:Fatty acid desaturase n=1 Tax=Spraguea lophii (strain 42_110) TaxID=1358809 RepID=S7WDJ6_SPRLO|nr:Fatty acid desaturase [Spraguea lophii 42_110]
MDFCFMVFYDEREPYFLGKWDRSNFKRRKFAEDRMDEPHYKRKLKILQDHPEIKNLYGYSFKTIIITILSFILFIIGCYISTLISSNYILFFCFAYFYGASLAALSGVIVHECCHLSTFRNLFVDQLVGIVANAPVIIPMAASFKKYHLDHHLYLGVEGKDPDLPLDIEITLFSYNFVTKIFYILIYPLFYAIRGFFIRKKITSYEIVNVVIHAIFIYAIYYFFGISAIAFWSLSTWMAYSIHPAGAHLIQEHFISVDGQETYSYYGILNTLFMNIGYHNEHHDFPSVPWDNLPRVKEIAPEYYDCLHYYTSWYGVLFKFIFDDEYGPFSRLVRSKEDQIRGKEIKVKSLEK